MMTDETVGRCKSQFSAIWGWIFPFRGDRVQGVNHFIEVLVLDGRAGLGGCVQAADLGQRLAAADFAGQAAPAERTPDQRADPLVEAEGHQLPLVFSADQRVIDLVGDIPRPAVAVGDGQGLHQVPAGKVGAGDVADLALADEGVQGVLYLFDGGEGVEAVQVVDVDVVGAEAAQASFKAVRRW